MTEAADPLHRHGVTGARAAVAKGVVRGDPGTEERPGVGRVERLGDPRRGRVGDDGILGIAAVEADARNLGFLAVDEEPFAARVAGEAVTPMPPHPGAITHLPGSDARADGVDAPGDLVPGNAREREPRERARLHERIAVADAAGFHLDPELARAGLRERALDELEWAIRLGNLDCLHRGHGELPSVGGES